MTEPTTTSSTDARAYRLLQSELVRARNRLDRQVRQLMRLSRLSRVLGHPSSGAPSAGALAEVVVDVLDTGFAAVWLIDGADSVVADFSAVGASVPTAAWRDAAADLTALVDTQGPVGLGLLPTDALPGATLFDVLACRALGRDGRTVALMLAASTSSTVGMDDPPGVEQHEVLALLADRVAEHLESCEDWLLIQRQVDQLQESESRLDRVLRGTNDGWWDWDVVQGPCVVSARWNEMLGHAHPRPATLPGLWLSIVHDDDRPAFLYRLDRALDGAEDEDLVETELRLRRADDSYLPVLVRGTISRDELGRAVRFSGSILDLTERKRYEEHVHRLAFYDSLTELPNRRLLMDRVGQSLLSNQRTGASSALLMIDLDRFKGLNDSHGHASGDQLLRLVARRLRDTVRGHDTVARLGGDEFVVLFEALDPVLDRAVDDALELSEKVLAVLNEPYALEDVTTRHGASIGVAVADGTEITPEALLRRADVAMYEAKSSGRNRIEVFRPDMQVRVDRRAELEQRLREDFEAGRLRMAYQAQVDAAGGLYGAEALMRWTTEDGVEVDPAVFIPVAEESGLIHALGEWAFRDACRQAVAWRRCAPGSFRVAVNVSPTEFMAPDFVAHVLAALEETGARGSEMRLEITEAHVVSDLEFAADRMRQLHVHGIAFSLDDFGTGYSSLTYLRQLPVDEVKISHLFVRRLLSDPYDQAIVSAVLALCTSLGIDVVAEGVETEAQWTRLGVDGCRYFQGWLFGHAVAPTADPHDLLADQNVLEST